MRKLPPIIFLVAMIVVGWFLLRSGWGNWGSATDPLGGIVLVIIGALFWVVAVVGILIVVMGKPMDDRSIDESDRRHGGGSRD